MSKMSKSAVCSIIYCESKRTKCVEAISPTGPSYHAVPKNDSLRRAWMAAVNSREGNKQKTPWLPADCSTVCSNHFTSKDFERPGILKNNSVPSIFPMNPFKSDILKRKLVMLPLRSTAKKFKKDNLDTSKKKDHENQNNKAVQVGVVSYKQEQAIRKIELENELFLQQNTQMLDQMVYHRERFQHLLDEINSSEFKQLEEVRKCASSGNVKAIYLLDQVNNFDKRQLTWSETSLQQLSKWRDSSGKGFAHVRSRNLLSCPSRSTLDRFAKDEENKKYTHLEQQTESASEVTIEIQSAET